MIQYKGHGMGPPLTMYTKKTSEELLEKASILHFSLRRKNEFSFDEFDGSLVIGGATLKGFIFDSRILVRRMRTATNRLKTLRGYKKRSTGRPWRMCFIMTRARV